MNFKHKRLLELAHKCIKVGMHDYIKMIIKKLLEIGFKDPEILAGISSLYIDMRTYNIAYIYAKKAFEISKTVDTLETLAIACEHTEKYEDAVIFYEELCKYKNNPLYVIKCSNLYEKLDLEEESIRILEEGYKKNEDLIFLANIVYKSIYIGLNEKVEYWVKILKEKYPNSALTENSLGFYYEAQKNDYEEAKKHFLKAAKLGYIEAYYNLGVCCKHSEDFENATKYLKKLHSIKGRIDGDYNYTLGSIYMAQRKMKLGFKYYFKRKLKNLLNNRQRKNYWDGKDYPDKILYIIQEQGYGDNIQFSRFIPYVAKKFKKVYFSMDSTLYDLMKRSFKDYKNIEIIKYGKHMPYHKFVMIMDIQNLLNISYHNIPHQKPYMITDEEKVYNFKIKHFRGEELKIGLNWRAKGMGLRDAVYRTIDGPYYFKKLLEIPNTKYYSFQMNDIFNMLEKYPQIIDLVPDIKNFDDTAAMLKNIDILITVDTAIAHLAGALGIKTYLLLCKAPDWRWFDNETKTEWYPNVTIIRQKDRRSWEDVSEKLYEYILEEHNKKH